MSKLTLGSLFDGLGTFPVAGLMHGITPLWASEIEPFPICVTKKRLPQMEHFGDITKLHGDNIPPVDIITAGFCCQDVSISGRRDGLYGSRTGLFFDAIRIVKEMRAATHGKPRYVVLENVLGLFSSGAGEHFRVVLEELARIKEESVFVPLPESGKWLHAGEILGDGYSIAWRVLDASLGWGVAQRRRRVFIVADLDGPCAGKILFESEGVLGHSAPHGPQGQGTAAVAFGGADPSGGRIPVRAVGFQPGAARRLGGHAWEEYSGALCADAGDNQAAVAYGISSDQSGAMLSPNPHSGIYEAHTSRTLDCSGGNPGCNQGGIAIVAPAYCMTVGGYAQAHTERAPTLMARDFKDPPVIGHPQAEAAGYVVRRLLPQECAMLQGFDPSWCAGLETSEPTDEEIRWWFEVFETHRRIVRKSSKPRSAAQIKKWLRNPHTDGAEYAAWGNGIALPCAAFVLAGIAWAEGRDSHVV